MIDVILIGLAYLIGSIIYRTMKPVVKGLIASRRKGHEFKPQITTDDKGVHINWKPTPKYDAHYTRRLEIEAGMEKFLQEYDMSLTTCGDKTCRTCYWKARNMLETKINNVILKMMNEKQNKFIASLPDDLTDAEYYDLLTKWKDELSQRTAEGISSALSRSPEAIYYPNENRIHLPRVEDDTITSLEDLTAKGDEVAKHIQYHMDKRIEYTDKDVDGHLYFRRGDDVQAMELTIPDGTEGYNDPTGAVGDKALRLIIYGGDEMLNAFGGGWTGEKFNRSQDFIARPVFGGEIHVSKFNVYYSGRPYDDEIVKFTINKTQYACKRRMGVRQVGDRKVSLAQSWPF